MATNALGKSPNHMGFLWGGNGAIAKILPLLKKATFGDLDTADSDIWNDWFFDKTVTANPYHGRVRAAKSRSNRRR